MGLIAREIEGAGVSTLAMTSAWDITAAVGPPRSAYVHRPLGHTTGAPGDLRSQIDIVRAALEAAPKIRRGEVIDLGFDWGESGWEARAYTPEESPVGPDGKPIRD